MAKTKDRTGGQWLEQASTRLSKALADLEKGLRLATPQEKEFKLPGIEGKVRELLHCLNGMLSSSSSPDAPDS